jgi:hypothetical protein
MTRTPRTFYCTDAEAALVMHLLAIHEELQALAASAPDGTVLEACENTVLERGREIQTRLLETAVASRVEAAEKKGPRSASVSAAKPKTTADPRPGNWSPPSG